MDVLKLLPGVDKRRALEEVKESGVIDKVALARNEGADARLVVVLKAAQLVVVRGVNGLLKVQHIEIVREGNLAAQIFVEALARVIVVLDIKGGILVIIKRGVYAEPAGAAAEALVYRLGEPHAVGIHSADFLARLLPELHRHEGRDVAAEAVDKACPHLERGYLMIPQRAVIIVKVDDVRPVADLVAGLAVRAVVEELRVLGIQNGVGRGVVIDDVYHALHAARVYRGDELHEVRHAAVLGVHIAVIAVRVGTAEAAFPALEADGVDRHEPYNVRAEGLDTVKVGYHGAERALRGVVSDVYGIDHLILELAVGIDGHGSASFYGFVERIYVFTHRSMVLQKEKYFNTVGIDRDDFPYSFTFGFVYWPCFFVFLPYCMANLGQRCRQPRHITHLSLTQTGLLACISMACTGHFFAHSPQPM